MRHFPLSVSTQANAHQITIKIGKRGFAFLKGVDPGVMHIDMPTGAQERDMLTTHHTRTTLKADYDCAPFFWNVLLIFPRAHDLLIVMVLTRIEMPRIRVA